MGIEVTKTNDAQKKRVTMLVYGEPKIGKTTLATTLGVPDSKVAYVNADEGYLALRGHSFDCITASGGDALSSIYEYCKENEAKYEWIVIDGIDNLAQDKLKAEQEAEKQGGSKPNQWAPWDRMADAMLAWFKYMRGLKPSILFITHINESEDEYKRKHFGPSFPGLKATKKLPELFDEIGVMRAVKIEDGEGQSEIKRLIQFRVEADEHFICGDRSGALDALEEPNISAIFKKIHEGINGKAGK